MRDHHKGYRRDDENLLITRLPLSGSSKCQVCGSGGIQVRHHTSDTNGIIRVWNVCPKCNNTIREKVVDAEPSYTIYGFYDKPLSGKCMVCSKPKNVVGRLVKHHYLEGSNVFVLRVCQSCNLNLPSNGIKANQRAIVRIQEGHKGNREQLPIRVELSEELTCKRCGHTWLPRKEDVRRCPGCNSAFWDKVAK